MNFYETLEQIMDEKGITAAELARMTGLQKSYFSKLKTRYTKDVTWEKAIVIISALGMTPDEFYRLQNQSN